MNAVSPSGDGLFVPSRAPLSMPKQDLFGDWNAPARRPAGPPGVLGRRLFVFGLAGGFTLLSAWQMYKVLDVGGLTMLEGALFGVFCLLNAWLSFSFASVLGGVAAQITGGKSGLMEPPEEGEPGIRTAILMPTYNEPPARVFGGLAAICESLIKTGHASAFDVYILSDTTDGEIWILEQETLFKLRERLGDGIRLYYRRRPRNIERKAGNIADWVRNFGGAYEGMLVLDADSIMAGDTILRLARLLEHNPQAGLIQTLPVIADGKTLYARAQSFAGQLYGWLIASGIAWWHGADGNFWGHNAIIRVRAFAESAGLPSLPGRKPFGGDILSHDFVEAALLRRAGWGVHMVPDLGGSYEEGPPTIGDNAIRDRRWAQGNLQHTGVLPTAGLHPISRMHLLMGIASYLAAPGLLVLVFLGLAIAIQAQLVSPDYFPKGFSLFPIWPAQDPVRAMVVLAGTLALLMLPKILALLITFGSRARSAAFGGRWRLLKAWIVEIALSTLLAPITMLDQTFAVLGILSGRDAGWQPQQRDDAPLPWRAVARAYRIHTLLGVLLAAGSGLISWPLFLWMMPMWFGLSLAIPVARLVSRRARPGTLAAPTDIQVPRELERAREHREALGIAIDATSTPIERLLANSKLCLAHISSLANLGERKAGDYAPERLLARAKIEDAETRSDALRALTPRETAAALSDLPSLVRLLELN